MTDVLVETRLEIERADIATWPDGAVLDCFVVRAAERPSARAIAEASEGRPTKPRRVPERVELDVEFDHEALPWHTVCTVSGPDRPGVLRAVTHAFAAAGVVVHSARIASIDGEVVDRSTISDRFDRKLDDRTCARVRAELAGRSARRRS